MPTDFQLIEEQLEVIQEQLRHQHEMGHAQAKTLMAHGKILRQILASVSMDAQATATAAAELKEATDAVQAALDKAQTKQP